jgi:hypothetical protein
MKALRSTLLVASLAIGSTFVILAGFEMISLASLALGVMLLIVAVSIGLAISSSGQSPKTVASMLYDVNPK